MCGIAGTFGQGWQPAQLQAMIRSQRHRGPDDEGMYVDPSGIAGLGHNRLSIIDLSAAGHQPMSNADGTLWIAFNGEIYNYLELRQELSDYPYRSNTDTEVILAAYERWGESCLEHFVGMFAFLIWDARDRRLFAARDRFGVKPLVYSIAQNGTLCVASEIKALWQAGVEAQPDAMTWATYLSQGHYDHWERTFWRGVRNLPAGHKLIWEPGRFQTSCWYDLAARVPRECDPRPLHEVRAQYQGVIESSVRLRFRSDVPVGINVSGGLDSSLLLGLTQRHWGRDCDLHAFTFVSGDPRYDETPWVRRMLAHTGLRSVLCELRAEDIPALAESVQCHQDEPFGGVPTLAYARLFEQARACKTIVLLDGQGLDEQWAGYDYFAGDGLQTRSVVQGTTQSPVRPDCLSPEFRALAEPFEFASPFPDRLRNLQYRDIRYTKIPRALRFNDRVSMRCSTELREPFLDHRLFEVALSQPAHHKIVNGTRKWLVREMAAELLPAEVVQAPKRPVQTPQREWLRGPLRGWAEARIEDALAYAGGSWLRADRVRWTWRRYCAGIGDNSFYVWQWISLGLLMKNGGIRLLG